MKAYDVYDLAEKQLKAFTRSKVRTKVMLCLMDGDMKVGELEDMIGIRATTILHAIKDMINVGFISKTVDGYALTNIGKMQTLLLDELVTSIVLLDQQRDFWLAHDISGIPDVLLAKIGMLGQSEIISANRADLMRSHERFVSELMNARNIKGLSPIILPDYPKLIANLVKKGTEVDLIVTKDILANILDNYSRKDINDIICEKNFRLYLLDMDLNIAFTVTESLLSLGLFRLDGGYDIGNDLICIGKNANKWGEQLFEHYCGMADLVECV